MGWRYFVLEIGAAADLLRRSRTAAAHYFYVRAVRKLTRRYERLLWEGEEARLRAAVGAVSALNEALEEVTPATEGRPLERQLRTIDEHARKLVATIRTENVPIGQIRNVERWLNLSAPDGRKVVIIEHAEGLGESSRNALLRLLEEPPAAAHVILLARRPEALIPTLRSRLREYALRARTGAEEREVLRRVFDRPDGEPGSLRGYFLNWNDLSREQLREHAQRFLEAVGGGGQAGIAGPSGGYAQAAGLPERLDRELLLAFLEELAAALRGRLRDGGPVPVLRAWSTELAHSAARVTELRLQPRHVLQSLGYAMRAAAHRGGAPARRPYGGGG
jgi:DNA polymerase-3 subunit gamma/tau